MDVAALAQFLVSITSQREEVRPSYAAGRNSARPASGRSWPDRRFVVDWNTDCLAASERRSELASVWLAGLVLSLDGLRTGISIKRRVDWNLEARG
jgi:hypothetical protein